MLRRSVATLGVGGLSVVGLAAPVQADDVEGFAGSRDAKVVWSSKAEAAQGGEPEGGSKQQAKWQIPAGSGHSLGVAERSGTVPPPIPEYDPLKNQMPSSLSRTFLPECWDAGVELAECVPVEPGDPAASGGPAAAPTPPTRAQVEAVVRTLVSRLRLPDAVPQVGPDPSVNEWNMAVVGHPLWLWVDGPGQMDTSVSGYGVTIRMDARRAGLSFAMGDGSAVRCTDMTAYHDGVEPGSPSPTCGYTYAKASLPKSSYRVTATAHWVVNWSAIGYSGAIPLDITDSRDLPVGELQAVVVR